MSPSSLVSGILEISGIGGIAILAIDVSPGTLLNERRRHATKLLAGIVRPCSREQRREGPGFTRSQNFSRVAFVTEVERREQGQKRARSSGLHMTDSPGGRYYNHLSGNLRRRTTIRSTEGKLCPAHQPFQRAPQAKCRQLRVKHHHLKIRLRFTYPRKRKKEPSFSRESQEKPRRWSIGVMAWVILSGTVSQIA